MQKVILLILLFSSLFSFAQNQREHFRGGMLLHTGFVQNQTDFPAVDGMLTGIGGKITFRAGEHLRYGTEGYVSNFGYGDNEGQYKLGWGGLLAEYQFNDQIITPVLGITIGGGKVHDLYVISGDFKDNFVDETIYKVYSSFIVTPHFSLEMRLSDHINLVGKVDYVFYPGLDYSSYVAKGPRVYFGVLFMR